MLAILTFPPSYFKHDVHWLPKLAQPEFVWHALTAAAVNAAEIQEPQLDALAADAESAMATPTTTKTFIKHAGCCCCTGL